MAQLDSEDNKKEEKNLFRNKRGGQ